MNHLLFIGVGQIVIIALVVLLLFGGTDPGIDGGLDKGHKIFKDESTTSKTSNYQY
ncbi:MAG: twin-arginine translocase TatA/TatE family subunit [Alistipes sp.]